MPSSKKISPMGFMGGFRNRRLRRRASSGVTKTVVGRYKAEFLASSVKHPKSAPKADVDLGSSNETAVGSVYEAVSEVDATVDRRRSDDEPYARIVALEPKEVWFGDPKDMRDEDLAFFELEK